MRAPRDGSPQVGSGKKLKRLKHSPQGQIVTVVSRGHVILSGGWSDVHPLLNACLYRDKKSACHVPTEKNAGVKSLRGF